MAICEIDLEALSERDHINRVKDLAGLARENGDYASEEECLEKILDRKPEHNTLQDLKRYLDRLQEVKGSLIPNVNGLFHANAVNGKSGGLEALQVC